MYPALLRLISAGNVEIRTGSFCKWRKGNKAERLKPRAFPINIKHEQEKENGGYRRYLLTGTK
jgi:hypothetical protein